MFRGNVGPRAPRFQPTIRVNSNFFDHDNALNMMDVLPSVASGAFTASLCGHKRKLELIETENAKKARTNKYNIENGLYGQTRHW